MITLEEAKKFIELYDKIEDLCKEIFNYTKENYYNLLEFGADSAFDKWELDDKCLDIIYYDRNYDLYETSRLPEISLHDITNWKDFIDNHYEAIYQKRHDNMIKIQKITEYDERKLYEELKLKYENS